MMVLAIAGSTPLVCFCATQDPGPVEEAPESCCAASGNQDKVKEQDPQPCHTDPARPGDQGPPCCCTIGAAPGGPLAVEQGAVLLDAPDLAGAFSLWLWTAPPEGIQIQKSLSTRDRPQGDLGPPLFDQHCLLLV